MVSTLKMFAVFFPLRLLCFFMVGGGDVKPNFLEVCFSALHPVVAFGRRRFLQDLEEVKQILERIDLSDTVEDSSWKSV